MRVTIFLLVLCSFFFCKGEIFTANRDQNLGTHIALTKNCVLHYDNESDSLDQFNKIIEDSDIFEDGLNCGGSNTKTLNEIVKTQSKWHQTKVAVIINKNYLSNFKDFQYYFGYSQPIYILIQILRI
jgi:hypothetical protein